MGEAGPLDVLKRRPNIGSRVNREVHARFWERLGVRFPRATRHCSSGSRARSTISGVPWIGTASCSTSSFSHDGECPIFCVSEPPGH